LLSFKVEILHPESKTFKKPQTGTVEERGDQAIRSCQLSENSLDLRLGKNDGKVSPSPGPDHAVELSQFLS
jgi:hypothetical protein